MPDLSPKSKEWIKNQVISWLKKEIIFESQAGRILNEYNIKYDFKAEKKPVNVIKVLAIIGAILLGLGVILFVASNWQKIPRLVKTLMLLAVTFGTFYLGYFLTYRKKENTTIGQALLFLSTLFYGGTIFLIAQMYNVNANSHWLVLFWAASILPVAYLLDSLPSYILTSVLFIVWDGLFNIAYDAPNYYYPAIMFLVLLPLSKNKDVVIYLNLVGLAIAQTYSVFNQYHWLVLLWALASLIYCFFTKSNIFSIASSLLFILWNIVWFMSFDNRLPFFYLIPLIFFIGWSYKDKLIPELIINLLGFWIWVNLFLGRYTDVILNKDAGLIHFLILQMSLGILFYSVGKAHEAFQKKYEFPLVYEAIGIVAIVLTGYVMSYKSVIDGVVDEIKNLFPVASLVFMGIAVVLVAISLMKGALDELISKFDSVVLGLAVIATTILILKPEYAVLNTVLFNILLFVTATASILYGFEAKSAMFFNAGIALFVILIVSRYFDIFWKLLDRSIFFIVGGLFLLIGAVFLERKRRKVVEQMKPKK